MHPNALYHVYNRGNNRQTIFYSRENYLFFLRKMRTHLLPVCDFLAYCLMPNHFHFLVKTDERTIAQVAQSNREIAVTAFSRGLKTMLSSYAQAIQRQEQLTGSLFQQKTKRKQVSSALMQEDYTLTCFRYILQNPLRANLVSHLEDWEFSSYLDLVGKRNGSLCNTALIHKELALDWTKLQDSIGMPVKQEEVKKIW
ncbi:MAG TPA: hypothetical protein PKD70_03995 [Saprospiraceae bacterium]|nr:hypothetical protein [Saprospiraceae bacterium]HMP13016.1 hypothetical protein [Saprospiraceae bacterium]